MTHIQLGNLIDSGIEHEDGLGSHGFAVLTGSINITDMRTMPARISKSSAMAHSSDGDSTTPEVLVLALDGEVLGSGGEDTVSTVYSIPWMDAGKLAAMLMNAISRSPDEHSQNDFAIGFQLENEAFNDKRENRSGDGH